MPYSKTKYRNGDICPCCKGQGEYELQRDAHRSSGIVPCHFSTSRPGSYYYIDYIPVDNKGPYYIAPSRKPRKYRKVKRRSKEVDLTCNSGTLTRKYSTSGPKLKRLNAIDARAKKKLSFK